MSDAYVDPRSEPAGEFEAYLGRLQELVAEAKAMPLSASIMVNKSEIQELLAAMREAMPTELREAHRVLRERDHILERADRRARRIIDDAQAEQRQMVSRTTVVQEAEREAERIVDEAEEHARQLRLEAEDYVDAKLANFEVVLQKTLQAVERGREKLQGTLHVEQLGEEEQAEGPPGQPEHEEPAPEARSAPQETRGVPPETRNGPGERTADRGGALRDVASGGAR